ncbi:MAG: hypothetical protein KJ799_18495 [Bacteroidetes bacterium]|nr:hypothetical protein [Bacteroidota bacterium]
MILLKIILTILLFCSTEQFAQFSIEKFLNEPFNQTYDSVKEKYSDKKSEEKNVMNFKSIMFYDWLEPISIKVGYMFTKDGNQNGKVLTNGKETDADSEKFLVLLKAALINKYGSDFSDKSMLGITMINWNSVEGYSVMVMKESTHTMLTIIKK